MPAGFAETPLNEDHASSEEPTMPTLVEEGLTSSMLRDPLQINDNDDYSSPEEPTMPKLTIEGIITNTSADITSPVSATLRKAVPSLVKTARKENPHMLNGVTSAGSSAQPEQECKENVKGSKKSDVQTTSVGRNKRRTKTTLQTSLDSNDKCDVETGKSHHLRKVTKHSCNICQSTNSATPKRSHPECDASASKRKRTKENPGPTEEFFAPLRQGWVREVVTRQISHSARHDVYYHPPYGKKLRSCVEIGKYLEKEGMTNLLTLDNFIFFAGTLGYGEPFEITRGANLKPPWFSPSSPKKEQKLMPKKGIPRKKLDPAPNSEKKTKTKTKKAQQKKQMAIPAEVAESSDEEYQVITEIAESDDCVALHSAETYDLETNTQTEIPFKKTKVEVKKNFTHVKDLGNICSKPKRKKPFQETENSNSNTKTQTGVVSSDNDNERYITNTGSPKRIRITAGKRKEASSMKKNLAQHFEEVEMPVDFPQGGQLSPKNSQANKVNETHPMLMGIDEGSKHSMVSKVGIEKTMAKNANVSYNTQSKTKNQKMAVQKKQIKKEKECDSEVLFVEAGIIENFNEVYVKATEPTCDPLLEILPTSPITEERVESDFFPVISSVKSGKEAEAMLETSEEPLRLWLNTGFKPQKAQREKTIRVQPTNGQKPDATAGGLRKWLKTNFPGSVTDENRQNSVITGDQSLSTMLHHSFFQGKSSELSKKVTGSTGNMNKNYFTTVKNQIQPMVSFPVFVSEMCNKNMTGKQPSQGSASNTA